MTEKTNIINVSRGQQLMFVLKEIQTIQSDPNLSKTTEFIIDESNISQFTMLIRPVEGLYEGLTIGFELTVPTGYPAPGHPINARCIDSIYHPNIFSGGRLCLKYDGVGNLDSGFKETLENLVVAINYLFMHPENYGYGHDMPIHMKETIKKNVDAYRLRKKVDKVPKHQTDRLYKASEIYDEKINHTLVSIKDWETYIPRSCLKEIKKSRYYMFTLGGRKIMDMATLEDVLSQIIRDPRYRFNTAPNLAFLNDKDNLSRILLPATPFSVVLAKFKRIVYPNKITFDPITNNFLPNSSLSAFFEDVFSQAYTDKHRIREILQIKCNVIVKSNYRFMFSCKKASIQNYPILHATKVEKDKKGSYEYIMHIDQYMSGMLSSDYSLIIDGEQHASTDTDTYDTMQIDPANPVWFYISYSVMNLGEDIGRMFTNTAYRLNPLDKNSPYVTIDKDNKKGEVLCRLLTDDELKLISGSDNDSGPQVADQLDDYYDIELASKYLASTAEQTGLDLRGIRYLN